VGKLDVTLTGKRSDEVKQKERKQNRKQSVLSKVFAEANRQTTKTEQNRVYSKNRDKGRTDENGYGDSCWKRERSMA
jgi:hypothetical protein